MILDKNNVSEQSQNNTSKTSSLTDLQYLPPNEKFQMKRSHISSLIVENVNEQ